MKISISQNFLDFLGYEINKESGYKLGELIEKKVHDLLPGAICYTYHVFDCGEVIMHFSNATTILNFILALRNNSKYVNRQIRELEKYFREKGYTIDFPTINHHSWNTPWTIPEVWIAALLVAIVMD